MDGGARWAIVHRVTKSQTWLKQLSTCIHSLREQTSEMPPLTLKIIQDLPSFNKKTLSANNEPGVFEVLGLQIFKLDLEKAEEPEIELPTSIGSLKNQESSRKISTSALFTMPKPLTAWITTNCGKFLNRWEYQTTLSDS